MEYHYYRPAKLEHLVLIIWEQRSDEPFNIQFLPSGFVELIFNIGPEAQDVKGKRVGTAFNPTENFCFLSGLHTRPLQLAFPRFHVMGVQMYPIAVKALFGLPGAELRDWALLGDLILSETSRIEDLLREQRDDFFTKARWLEDYLLDKIRETSELYLAIKMKETLGKVKRHLWEGKRVDITDYTGYSRMHTYQLFSDWFGTGPSQTLRLHQFVHAVQLMHTQSLSLNQIGLASGFYDQAHFIRVFREFAAMTPGCYKKQMTDFPGQLFW